MAKLNRREKNNHWDNQFAILKEDRVHNWVVGMGSKIEPIYCVCKASEWSSHEEHYQHFFDADDYLWHWKYEIKPPYFWQDGGSIASRAIGRGLLLLSLVYAVRLGAKVASK